MALAAVAFLYEIGFEVPREQAGRMTPGVTKVDELVFDLAVDSAPLVSDAISSMKRCCLAHDKGESVVPSGTCPVTSVGLFSPCPC